MGPGDEVRGVRHEPVVGELIGVQLANVSGSTSLSNSKLFFTHNFPKCVALPLHSKDVWELESSSLLLRVA